MELVVMDLFCNTFKSIYKGTKTKLRTNTAQGASVVSL